MAFDYRNAVAVVTGASSGLGRRMALDLAGRGAVVTGIARRPSPTDHVVQLDVGDTDAFAGALRAIEAERGRIDILINAAATEERVDVDELTADDVAATMRVNFDAVVAGTLTVLPGMVARHHGAVVNVSSDSGRAPGPGNPAYCASKAALSAFTESLAFDTEGTGVHLHVLYPGWVPTPMGQGAVDAGMPMPPKMVRRTEQQVSDLVLSHIGGKAIDINAAKVATLAPAVRALAPRLFRRALRQG